MACFAGIDVSAKTFDLVIRRDDKNGKPGTFDQTPEGFKSAAKILKKKAVERVVIESTGVYYLDLAVALADAGLPVSVVNPRMTKHFADALHEQTKTDARDAAMLAEYGQRMTPRLWTPPDQSLMALRDVGRQINRLVHARTQAKNRLHALGAKQGTLSLLVDDEREGIEQLDKRVERLRQAALQLISESESLSRQWNRIRPIKGIGEASAIAILAELAVLPSDMKANQVARYAGLSVVNKQSGTSVRSPGRLSKTGNAYLRAAMYMPALCASNTNPVTKAFRDKLVDERGKKPIQATTAVMRKYLTGIWASLQTDTPFEAERLFSEKTVARG